MNRKLWNMIEAALDNHPSQIISSDSMEVEFTQVKKMAEELARILIPGIHVICCKSEFNSAIALLACFCAGVTAIPLSERYGILHCDRILCEAEADFQISDETGKIEVRALKESMSMVDDVIPALIMFTSGTTGAPKGIMLSEDNILSNLESIEDYFNITEKDCILIARPLYHCAVLTGEFLISLLHGVHIVFSAGAFDPMRWADLISEYQVSVLGGTPTLLAHLGRLTARSGKLRSLQKIVVSGERLTKNAAVEVRQMFSWAEIYSVYGLTEASPRVTALPPALFDIYPDSCGMPIKGVKVRIVGSNEEELPPLQVGELEVKGGNVMLGYYNNMVATENVLCNGWLRTGDVAYKDEKGFIYIKGRRDDMIIYAGINIYPQEIESVMRKLEGVTDALVCSVEDKLCGQKIVMYISGYELDICLVRDYCKHNLPDYECPQEIHIVQEIKKNGSGKIIRNQFLSMHNK